MRFLHCFAAPIAHGPVTSHIGLPVFNIVGMLDLADLHIFGIALPARTNAIFHIGAAGTVQLGTDLYAALLADLTHGPVIGAVMLTRLVLAFVFDIIYRQTRPAALLADGGSGARSIMFIES